MSPSAEPGPKPGQPHRPENENGGAKNAEMRPIASRRRCRFTEIIDAWLDGDKDVDRRQRHAAKRVFDRLRAEHGLTGGFTIIKDYMRNRERRSREMLVPLAHPPGHALSDFGEATVIMDGVEQKAHFFVMGLPHSDACFVRA